MQKLRNIQGFTLVEIIVVMTIIGILVAVLLPKIIGAPANARDADRIVSLNLIAMALENYHSDHLAYPESSSGDWGCIDLSNDLIVKKYLDTVPKDPIATNNKLGCLATFSYLAIEKNGFYNSYILAAGVERKQKANVDWDDIKDYDKNDNIQDIIDTIDNTPDIFVSGDIYAYAIYGR